MSDVTVEPIDHTGDAGFVVTAPTLTRLFTACAEQMTRLACPGGEIRRVLARPVAASGYDLAELLVRWLAEIHGLAGAHREVYGAFFVDVLVRAEGACRIAGRADGEPADPGRHPVAREIKAVTYHQAAVEEVAGGWRGRVVFDL